MRTSPAPRVRPKSNLPLPSFLAIGLILLIPPTIVVLAAAVHYSDPSALVLLSQPEAPQTQAADTVGDAKVEPSSMIAKK